MYVYVTSTVLRFCVVTDSTDMHQLPGAYSDALYASCYVTLTSLSLLSCARAASCFVILRGQCRERTRMLCTHRAMWHWQVFLFYRVLEQHRALWYWEVFLLYRVLEHSMPGAVFWCHVGLHRLRHSACTTCDAACKLYRSMQSTTLCSHNLTQRLECACAIGRWKSSTAMVYRAAWHTHTHTHTHTHVLTPRPHRALRHCHDNTSESASASCCTTRLWHKSCWNPRRSTLSTLPSIYLLSSSSSESVHCKDLYSFRACSAALSRRHLGKRFCIVLYDTAVSTSLLRLAMFETQYSAWERAMQRFVLFPCLCSAATTCLWNRAHTLLAMWNSNP